MVSGGQTLVTSQRDSHGESEMASERKNGVRVNAKTAGTRENAAATQQTPRTTTGRAGGPSARAVSRLRSFSEHGCEAEGHRLHGKGPEGRAKDKNEH